MTCKPTVTCSYLYLITKTHSCKVDTCRLRCYVRYYVPLLLCCLTYPEVCPMILLRYVGLGSGLTMAEWQVHVSRNTCTFFLAECQKWHQPKRVGWFPYLPWWQPHHSMIMGTFFSPLPFVPLPSCIINKNWWHERHAPFFPPHNITHSAQPYLSIYLKKKKKKTPSLRALIPLQPILPSQSAVVTTSSGGWPECFNQNTTHVHVHAYITTLHSFAAQRWFGGFIFNHNVEWGLERHIAQR